MTVDLYQTGVSGLVAAQQQLATTGHNIANVNTEGYNRQRVEQTTMKSGTFGSNFLGSGTLIQDIARVYSDFAYKEQLFNTTKLGNANIANSSLNQLNDVMTQSGNAVMSSLENFYSSINSIADNPSDSGLRTIALSQAEILTRDFQYLNTNFDEIEKASNIEIEQIASKISDISVELAQINSQVLNNSTNTSSGKPNDLLDTRDRLLTELSEYTNVTTVTDQNGLMTVMIGNGSTLVAGITPLSMRVTAGDPDPLQTSLELVGPNSTAVLSPESLGGALSAKFQFRDQDVQSIRSEINRLAMAISETFNSAQAQGLDLTQQQGGDFFTDINSANLQQSRVLTPSTNAGTLTAQVEITDISILPTDEFQVRYDGANYVMTNLNTMATENLTLVSPGVYSSTQGFNFVTTGGAVATDDTFIIRPTENAASLMEVQISNGDAIAASSPVLITPSDNNISTGGITVSEVYDPVAARTAMDMSISILESPPGTFNFIVTDNTGTPSAPQAYTPPSQFVDLPLGAGTPAFQIEITGTPSGSAPNAPEIFNFTDAYGIGNGKNAELMALSQEQNIINGGQETFVENLGVSISVVGSKAKSAELVADTAEALLTQAYNRNQEISGVSLDEEAANLIKFQQAYQAASRIISVANTIFDSLLQAAR